MYMYMYVHKHGCQIQKGAPHNSMLMIKHHTIDMIRNYVPTVWCSPQVIYFSDCFFELSFTASITQLNTKTAMHVLACTFNVTTTLKFHCTYMVYFNYHSLQCLCIHSSPHHSFQMCPLFVSLIFV